MNRCTTCKFHTGGQIVDVPGPNGEKVPTPMGWCYRYPPQVTGQGMSSSPPVKSETTWCGEWARKRNRLAWWLGFATVWVAALAVATHVLKSSGS